MIKAEIISHEGNPGANWLDRCRTLITPRSISVLVIVVAAAGIIIGLTQKHSNNVAQQTSASNNSQPANAASPLSVQAPQAETYQAANGTATVQAASGSSQARSAVNGVTNGSAPLNATATTPDASQQSSFDQQTGLSGRSLTNLKGIQSTIQPLNSTLNTIRGLGNKLGL